MMEPLVRARSRLGRARPAVALLALVAALALLVAPAAAAPPPNDNRADAAEIPAFPSQIAGTTVEATVERLDPQVSKCGPVEGSVWYRISQAPDGTIAVSAQGAGFAPVIRVYTLSKSGIDELSCGSAAPGTAASAIFAAQRGANYLVLVGRRPGTADAAFTLDATLTLPPSNDSRGQAALIPKLPATVTGTTLAATYDGETDSAGSGLEGGGSVWYSLSPAPDQRVLVTLQTRGGFDGGLAVFERTRSQIEEIGSDRTDRAGRVAAAFDTVKGSTYLIMVGTQRGSRPGEFVLDTKLGEPREKAPGQPLAPTGVLARVDWITDVNDVYSTTLTAGTTYRIAFVSGGATVTIVGPRGPAGGFDESGYRTITPGPASEGRYTFDVIAPEGSGPVSYRLAVKPAQPDDVGVGLLLRPAVATSGTIAPELADLVDVYHFVVAGERSNIRVSLDGTRRKSGITMTLVNPSGEKVATSARHIERPLEAGRYVLAVQGTMARRGGPYTVAFAVRQKTITTIRAPRGELPSNAVPDIRVAVDPRPTAGKIVIRVERFDATDGWVFAKSVSLDASGGPVGWKPPTPGRWRIAARYVGTIAFSPSSTRLHEFTVTRARELAPGRLLPAGGVMQTVDWKRDVNDVYRTTFEAGTTYLVAFTSDGARIAIRGPLGSLETMRSNGFRTFTPGPEAAGEYTFDVTAPEDREKVAYRLVVRPAGRDDIGIGVPLRNLEIVRGTLEPAAADVVDLYRFTLKDVRSDVRLRLTAAKRSGIGMTLMTETGQRLGAGAEKIVRGLPAGQYIVAVRGTAGRPEGDYSLRLIARRYTTTTVSLASATVRFGSTATIAVAVEPRPGDGTLTAQIDRLDPTDGWVFTRTVSLSPTGGSFSWTPPLLGRYRIRATYSGSIEHTPSRSAATVILVTDALT